MDSIQVSSSAVSALEKEKETYASAMVDPFLIEALQNPRHRLTMLRMELDIQKFIQNPEQLQFEFPHFPTSYLRLAAHRVAQHYGLQTIVLDNFADGTATKIVVTKTAGIKYPSVCLSDIPAKQSDNIELEPGKIAIRRRPCRTSSGDAADGMKGNTVRSVEERKEEYDRARARIFSGPGSPSSDETLSPVPMDVKVLSPSNVENGGYQNSISDSERTAYVRDVGTFSRVAIFKDREKDLTDPDYDRSYERYVRSFPAGQRFLPPFNMPNFQPPFVQYDVGYPQMAQIPRAQTLNYGPSSDPSMNQYCTMALNQPSRDAVYMQWPSPTMMYAHSYEQFRHSVFQAPFCQQPLSFDYSQNH